MVYRKSVIIKSFNMIVNFCTLKCKIINIHGRYIYEPQVYTNVYSNSIFAM